MINDYLLTMFKNLLLSLHLNLTKQQISRIALLIKRLNIKLLSAYNG